MNKSRRALASRVQGLLSVVCCAVGLAACASTSAPALKPTAAASTIDAIDVPKTPTAALAPRVVIASGLANPRGLLLQPDGSLLVSIAGNGDPATGESGALLRLHDDNADGDFDDGNERTTLLDKQPSKNILDIVRRDEVFGMAGMDSGDGVTLVALAFFGGPSTIFRIDGDRVTPWATTHGNINDVAYDPTRKQWFGTSSTTDEVVHLIEGGHSERVMKLPPLASGQDPVPAYLRYDPLGGDLLVSLFSGSPEGEEGGTGVELVERAASIVAVHPETRTATPVVTSLSVPTDLEVGPDGSIYVLEFCDSFLDPVPDRASMQTSVSNGGFRRFSGRLLRIDRTSRQVSVIANGLDAPTNLLLAGKSLYISEGMGTPGRKIPGPQGQPVALTGFVEKLTLP